MRGVAGLELEILRAKAAGFGYPGFGDEAISAAFSELCARGLLVPTDRKVVHAGVPHRHHAITTLGRAVLAASTTSAQGVGR